LTRCQSRHLPKTYPNVQEVVILGEDLLNLPLWRHHYGGQIREGNPRFILKPIAQFYGFLEPSGRHPLQTEVPLSYRLLYVLQRLLC